MTLAEFRRVYPTAAFTVSSGKPFTYRYYQNPQAKATLVLLTGGIGLSDLFYKHFARFARDFSVLTFDYQLQFADNGEFADAVEELLRHLKEKAAMEELCNAMIELLTKSYEAHMIDFLCDAEHYFGMTRDDFAPWEGRVLLILSEDDTTFTPACRKDLIALMPSPMVGTDLTGGPWR